MSEHFATMKPISSVKLALLTQKLHQEIEGTELLGSEPIAILGMGCRLPGGVETPEGYWQLLQQKVDAVGEMGEERWKQCYPEESAVKPWGGFLDQVDQFDPYFFGIPPREIVSMDPQHRLLLETTWEALERSGQRMEDVSNSKTGVFVAIYQNDYLWHLGQSASRTDRYLTSGNAHSLAVNRISYLLNAQGPSMAIDTACSSSLVAIHLACQSLRNQECDMALAGGVNLILTPLATDAFLDWNVLSADRRCKTFDAQADGMVRGEGCGMIVLKRFADALADGDPIAAIIRGSAVNQDGRSNGFTVPNGHAQRAVIRQALKNAMVDPSLVSYIETHGTGTALGDPIEVEALTDIYGKSSISQQTCVLGATKTNIGHLEAAAGIAGLIKAVLAFQHEAIPANLHFQTLNPYISLDGTRFVLPDEMQSWPAGAGLRYAAVSSFGMGGTNAHVILEEAPRRPGRKSATQPITEERPYLLPLSAHSPEALQGQAQAYLDFFSTEAAETFPLEAICASASVRRSHHLHRLALVARSLPDMQEQLQSYLRQQNASGRVKSSVRTERIEKIVFVCSGVGSQWAGMGRQLLEQEPVFGASIDACEEAFRSDVDWSLRQELEADEQSSRLNQVEIMQPALFAIQVALAALWRSWGIEPAAVVGHSMGEIAAAHIAGALSLTDAAHIICVRGQLLKRVQGQGAMGMVQLSMEKVQQALKGYEGQVSIAAKNSPQSLVISGEAAAVEKIMHDWQEQGIFCRKVNTDVAFHSPQMDVLLADFRHALSAIRPVKASIPMFSTVTNTICTGSDLDAQYWSTNLREQVLFDPAIQIMAEQGLTTFLELSPHPVLLQAIEGSVQHVGRSSAVFPSLARKKQDLESMLNTLGSLYKGGYPVQWSQLYDQADQYVPLPTYRWQRERFWVDYQRNINHNSDTSLLFPRKSQTLLGKSISLAHDAHTHIWEGILDVRELPVFNEHAIQGLAILPASGYIEMALEAAPEIFGTTPLALRDISFEHMLPLTDKAQDIQLVVASQTQDNSLQATFQLFSRQNQHTSSQDIWRSHVRGSIVSATEETTLPGISFDEFQRNCQLRIDGEQFYTALRDGGFYYGPAFQGVDQLWLGSGDALARLRLTETVQAEWDFYRLHPGLLDACLQVVAATVTSTLGSENAGNGTSAAYLPVHIGQIAVHRLPDKNEQLWSYARLVNDLDSPDAVPGADLYIMNEAGQVLLEVRELQFQSLDAQVADVRPNTLNEALYTVQWQASPLEALDNEGAGEGEDGSEGVLSDAYWLIFAHQDEFANELQAQLEKRGEPSILVYPGDIYDRLNPTCYTLNPEYSDAFSQLLFDAYTAPSRTCRGVLYLWSTSPETEEHLSLEALAYAEKMGCGGALSLAQALSYADWIEMPCLWLVTRGTQSVNGQTSMLSVSQAPLWGLGRTLTYEHPDMHCTCIDLSMQVEQTELELLCAVLHTNQDEDQIVLRNAERYVARLVPYSVNDVSTTEQGQLTSLRYDATYLITGGLGGLGLKVASWMVEQGARSLALLGRSAPGQEASAVIQSLEEKGAEVFIFQGDVSIARDVADVIERLAATAPPLRGIVHAAAVLDDGMLARLNQKRLQTVLAPKVAGAWNLHTHTIDTPLDFFILFSSLASLLGPPGQGNYAAANAFLDSLAHFRHAQGLPATSINWCGWSEVGMAATQTNSDERTALQGVASITPEQGLTLFDQFLRQAPVQVGVLPLDFDKWQYIVTQRRVSPLLGELIHTHASQHKAGRKQRNTASTLRQELLATTVQTERIQILAEYLCQQVAEVLHIETHLVDPNESLNNFALDSLMALELKTRAETDLQASLSIIAFIHGSSIYQLAQDLLIEAIPSDALAENESANSDESSTIVIPLQARGNKRPFFCIHGAMGYVHGYDELAYCIDNERPFYGIQALGLDGREEPIADLHEVAARYIEEIQKVQAQGPYLLGGSSFGGVLALEMARQLEQQGQEIGFLALIDSILPVGTAISAVLQDEVQILIGAFKFISYFFNDELKVSEEELRQIPSEERIDYLLTHGSVKNTWIESFGREQAYSFMRVFLSILEINKHYNPMPITQHVTFFRANETLPANMFLPGFPTGDLVQPWTAYAEEPIEVYDIPGNHVTMNREPHVRILANHMRACIERFEEKSTSLVANITPK